MGDHVVQLASDPPLLLGYGAPRLLTDGNTPVSRRFPERPRAYGQSHREQAVPKGGGEEGRGHHGLERSQADQRPARRTSGGQRANREQARDRHDRLGGKQLDSQSSDDGDGHDQLGTPAPPVQGAPWITASATPRAASAPDQAPS